LQHLEKKTSLASSWWRAEDEPASSASGHVTRTEEAECEEEAELAPLDDLEQARACAQADNAAAGACDFVSRVRGRMSKTETHAVGADARQGQTTNRLAKEWAVRRGLQVTFKATFAEHGKDACIVLVRSWCHRMQFFDMELASQDGPGLVYTRDMVNSYLEPTELVALAADHANENWRRGLS